MVQSFFWHDYETWGANPRWDRPSQFAGIRTDLDFNIIGEPVSFYCRPAIDRLPEPVAAMVTGISPWKAEREGLSEAEFFRRIHQALAEPGTCGLGYNSLRFDDEVTRYGLYRNFYDPYSREWRNGCSRWDIIDMVRLVRALRPEGIEWPRREDSHTSFRLEDLTRANGIAHEGAHDALVDVVATIELAKLIRKAQPKLYDYVLENKDKASAAKLLNLADPKPILHISRMFPAERGAMAVILPLLADGQNKNAVHSIDLAQDPDTWLALSPEEIRRRLYANKEALAEEGLERPAFKTVHLNKCPVLAPLNTLTERAKTEWHIDLDTCFGHQQRLESVPNLEAKLKAIFAPQDFGASCDDPEQMLYDGFITDADRRLCDQVLKMNPAALTEARMAFGDKRLPELLFRYRARNWPDSLKSQEGKRWEALRSKHLHHGPLKPADYFAQIDDLREKYPDRKALLDDLESWAKHLGVERP